MHCTIPDCPGTCEPAVIKQFYPGKHAVTISGVPASICQVCGEAYLDPETQAQVQRMVRWAASIHRQEITYHARATSPSQTRMAVQEARNPNTVVRPPLGVARHRRHPRHQGNPVSRPGGAAGPRRPSGFGAGGPRTPESASSRGPRPPAGGQVSRPPRPPRGDTPPRPPRARPEKPPRSSDPEEE